MPGEVVHECANTKPKQAEKTAEASRARPELVRAQIPIATRDDFGDGFTIDSNIVGSFVFNGLMVDGEAGKKLMLFVFEIPFCENFSRKTELFISLLETFPGVWLIKNLCRLSKKSQ